MQGNLGLLGMFVSGSKMAVAQKSTKENNKTYFGSKKVSCVEYSNIVFVSISYHENVSNGGSIGKGNKVFTLPLFTATGGFARQSATRVEEINP